MGSLIFGKRTGLIVALLLAVSQLGIAYPQKNSSFPMTMCVSIFVTILFCLALRRRMKLFWLGFLLSAALTNYLHYVRWETPASAGGAVEV